MFTLGNSVREPCPWKWNLIFLAQSTLILRLICTGRTIHRKTFYSQSTLSLYPNCLKYKNHHADFDMLSNFTIPYKIFSVKSESFQHMILRISETNITLMERWVLWSGNIFKTWAFLIKEKSGESLIMYYFLHLGIWAL